ncbi:hypothetical protein RF11_10510 [Thelohanellus kitauei]|uniref:Uncharacterized protein n=1 Tax=Thelohanellus kitauei TaxID=669202 RepID=A0A0C2JHB0_THEKT|nr:hypothetical protein RF11_10510 [Thelohanellus kitauei]
MDGVKYFIGDLNDSYLKLSLDNKSRDVMYFIIDEILQISTCFYRTIVCTSNIPDYNRQDIDGIAYVACNINDINLKDSSREMMECKITQKIDKCEFLFDEAQYFWISHQHRKCSPIQTNLKAIKRSVSNYYKFTPMIISRFHEHYDFKKAPKLDFEHQT